MSYFEDASLVLIPSAQKLSKIYSVKPTDGSGDMAFTRSNDTATRVASNGLIERVRTNVALYSEDLTNAAWTKNRSTITANALVNPVNGATTADYIVEDTANGTHEAIQIFTVVSGVSYTVSVYAKADTRTKIALVLAGSAFASGGNGQAIFNLSTGAVISAINGATARISDAGNGWYRCSITKASIDTSGVIALELVDASDNTSYTGDGTSRAAFFGAQLEVSDFGPTPYIATTSAAVSVGPVANVPRLDYSGGASCPKLILEGQRTNLVTYSEQFDNAAWLKYQVSVSANQAVSPDGYQNADKITLSGGSGTYTGLIYTASTPAANSIYMKNDAIGSGKFYIQVDGVGNAAWNVDGTLSSVTGGTAVNGVNMGNGWFRFTYVCTGGTYVNYGIQNGTTGSSIFIWGAQVEAGAYATSYIPTLGAAVTRGAEQVAKTSVSTLIGQAEGTLFVEANLTNVNAFNAYLLQVSESGSNRFFIYRDSSQKLGCFALIGSSVIYQTLTASAITGTVKAAFAYKSGSFAFYVNGAQVGTSAATFTTPPSMGIFNIDSNAGAENGFYTYAQALLFKTRLSNADLAALTA